jgi:hydrogenase maturation protease
MRTLVLGLGNPILGDDSVGLRVAESVQGRLPPDTGIEVDTDFWGGLRLMERLIGYDQAIIIDAICSGLHQPGALLTLGVDDVPTQHTASAHDVNLPTALRLAATMGLSTPQRIVIIAIEAENVLDFGEQLSPAVAAAIPAAVEAVLAEVSQYRGKETAALP